MLQESWKASWVPFLVPFAHVEWGAGPANSVLLALSPLLLVIQRYRYSSGRILVSSDVL